MKPLDIVPFGLPNCPAGEIRFEDPRDIERVIVRFAGAAAGDSGCSTCETSGRGTAGKIPRTPTFATGSP